MMVILVLIGGDLVEAEPVAVLCKGFEKLFGIRFEQAFAFRLEGGVHVVGNELGGLGIWFEVVAVVEVDGSGGIALVRLS